MAWLMIIRPLERNDADRLVQIHDKHYSDEFIMPDFFDKFFGAFIIENDAGDIVTAGGIRTILECITLSNKDRPPRERMQGLVYLLTIGGQFALNTGYSELHAFVQSDTQEKFLRKLGFHETKGKALVLELPNGKG
jgi:hypothetical protein